MTAETIVAAALCRDKLIYSAPQPARHGDLMRMADSNHGNGFHPFLPDEQGFLTSAGRFVSRRAAARIAIHTGQIETTQWGGDLYSEDLW